MVHEINSTIQDVNTSTTFEVDISSFSKGPQTSFPAPPKFSTKSEEREYLKFRLAQAFRIFGHLGYDEGVAGHITCRDPIKPDCFWVNPFVYISMQCSICK